MLAFWVFQLKTYIIQFWAEGLGSHNMHLVDSFFCNKNNVIYQRLCLMMEYNSWNINIFRCHWNIEPKSLVFSPLQKWPFYSISSYNNRSISLSISAIFRSVNLKIKAWRKNTREKKVSMLAITQCNISQSIRYSCLWVVKLALHMSDHRSMSSRFDADDKLRIKLRDKPQCVCVCAPQPRRYWHQTYV